MYAPVPRIGKYARQPTKPARKQRLVGASQAGQTLSKPPKPRKPPPQVAVAKAPGLINR